MYTDTSDIYCLEDDCYQQITYYDIKKTKIYYKFNYKKDISIHDYVKDCYDIEDLWYIEPLIDNNHQFRMNSKYCLHSFDDKPAMKVYDEKGNLKFVEYHKNGKLHRDNDLPAMIFHIPKSYIKEVSYYVDGNKEDIQVVENRKIVKKRKLILKQINTI